jgi:cardiolipin synthase
MQWNLPNTLTVLRLLAAPVFVAVYIFLARPYADWIGLSLFVAAALTDYFDGFLARRWKQVSSFGRMLDPIADKAMTVLALAMLLILMLRDERVIYFPAPDPVILGDWLLVVPVMVILFREIFISGLREFLGADAGQLAVTRLAKWKTAIQMIAVSALLAVLLFEHYFYVLSFAMEREQVAAILAGEAEDRFGLVWKYWGWITFYNGGLILLWLAALLTAVTGLDYFRKATPYLSDER